VRHAHVQIEYTGDKGQVESLVGFNPTRKKDRKFVHDLLDEYLDYVVGRLKSSDGNLEPLNESNGFRIFDNVDGEEKE
jgi:hypothetical protein